MPAKDLGTKHTCWKCGTKFYDLKKPSPACPKCGADPRQAPVVKAPSAAAQKRAAAKAAAAAEPDLPEEAEVEEELDEADEEPAEEADDE